jgi:hypothetical protein
MRSIKKEYRDRVEYYNKQGQIHREDGPAIIFHKGGTMWLINGKYHREDGPAVVYSHGGVSFYLNNIRYLEQEWEQELTKIKLRRILDL